MRKAKLALFFVCKAVGLFRLSRWATRNRLKILCYHGFELADETQFRPKLFIKPATFETRLSTIRRYRANVLRLDDAIDRLYSRTLPDNALVITVDDGFHSFHRAALPLLRRFGYPATVYVTTYYVAKGNPIFRLVVQYMFWKTARQSLSLALPGLTREAVDISDAATREQLAWDIICHGERKCSEEQRLSLCDALGASLDVAFPSVRTTRMLHLMTPAELRTLAQANVDIELHTHRHTFPDDDRETAEREITDNRDALSRLGGVGDTKHFCYPSGCWHERQSEWLDGLQVKSSATCLAGSNSPTTPRHALRRFLDGENIRRLEFEAALSGFSDIVRDLAARLRRSR